MIGRSYLYLLPGIMVVDKGHATVLGHQCCDYRARILCQEQESKSLQPVHATEKLTRPFPFLMSYFISLSSVHEVL